MTINDTLIRGIRDSHLSLVLALINYPGLRMDTDCN